MNWMDVLKHVIEWASVFILSTAIGWLASGMKQLKKRRNTEIDEIKDSINKLNDKMDLSAAGVRIALRSRLPYECEKWLEAGYCPYEAREQLQDLYDSYHALKGNGVIAEKYHRCVALPYHPEEKERAEA